MPKSKSYLTAAITYALLALLGGVFFREFTKAVGYTGLTTLSVVHTHFFMMGMVFFILLALLENVFGFSHAKHVQAWIVAYQVGLNITVAGLLARGIAQATQAVLSKGLDASLSGVSGIGHAALGISLVMILLTVRKAASKQA